MQPARQDLPVTPGTTYRDTVRIMQPVYMYRAITAIAGAPAVFTVPAHGLDSDWPVWIRGVSGMPEANREPFKQLPHRATRLSADSLEINALSASGLTPAGGQLVYRMPVDLSGASIEMVVSHGIEPLLTLQLGAGLASPAPGTVTRVLTPAQTLLLTGDDLGYAFDVTFADGTVTRYFQGAIAGEGAPDCCDQAVVTLGEQGPPGISAISSDPNNRLTFGTDRKLFVADDLSPDPLNYYILAKG